MTHPARHLAVTIASPAAGVYAYAADPAHLAEWASGLADGAVMVDGGVLVVDSPMGRVTVEFAPTNEYGVLDHVVTLPTGASVLNPMRVAPNGDGCDVVFTVHRRPEMSAEEFEKDCATVQRDLDKLCQQLQV